MFDVPLTVARNAGVLAGWLAGVPPAFPKGGEDAACPAAETTAFHSNGTR
jgi:hypothetical protein